MSSSALSERPIVLTGASGGIGVALTDYFLTKGFTRIAVQYNKTPEGLVRVLEQHGLDPAKHCFGADLTSEDAVGEFGESVRAELGTPWGIVNLAGSSSNALSWKLPLEEFQTILANSLTTTFLVCREFIPAMREAAGGRIVNVSSVVAFTGVAGASHYCAAKAGVVGFTKSIARELVSKRVTANVLALGYFDYGMLYTVPEELREGIRQQIPARRFGTAAEIGGTLIHLLSDEAAYTNGQILHVNGGMYG